MCGKVGKHHQRNRTIAQKIESREATDKRARLIMAAFSNRLRQLQAAPCPHFHDWKLALVVAFLIHLIAKFA
jgi:hypothetical protein